ncbi:urea ABC transporter permease subunit UrtB, partial [Arcobacter sp. 31_11_sub10_T18]
MKIQIKFIQIILLNLLFLSSLFSSDFKDDIKSLTTKSYKVKTEVINTLVEKHFQNEKLILLLKSMLNNELFYTKKDKTFVTLVKKDGKKYHTVNLLTNEKLEIMKKRMFKKVKTNNKLRSIIRSKLAQLNLFSQDESIRLESAKNIFKNINKSSLELINKALLNEKSEEVKEVLIKSKTILHAKFGTYEEQLNAVKDLADALSPQALQALKEISNNSSQKELKVLALQSIEEIESSKSFYAFIEKIFFGLSLGSVLLLAAIGLAITFGVMKVINMAHGEMIM